MSLFTLVGELPPLTAAMERLADLARKEGIEFTTADFGGVRNEPDTVKILGYREAEYAKYAAGERQAGRVPMPMAKWRPIASYGKSHHNYGAARDVRPIKWPAGKSFQWAHDRLDAITESDPALKVALRIGDYFNDEPHFELRITLEQAKAQYTAHLAIVTLAGLASVFIAGVVLWSALDWGRAHGWIT